MISRNFLSYWHPETALSNLQEGSLLEHSASEQYKRVKPGDTVWIVTAYSGSLHLLGRIIVGAVTNQREAAEMLGTNNLWESGHHIIAARNTAEPIRNIRIDQVAERLRFESASGRDRLLTTNGLVRAQQLQTMRVLTADSASLLKSVLHTESGSGPNGNKKESSHKTTAPPRHSPPNKREIETVLAEKQQSADRESLLETLHRLQDETSPDLLKPEYRDSDLSEAPYNGHCYVLSECMWRLFPGIFTPYRTPTRDDGSSHWFLRLSDGSIFESITRNAAPAKWIQRRKEYEKARRRVGFLRKWPSGRARELLKKAGLTLPN